MEINRYQSGNYYLKLNLLTIGSHVGKWLGNLSFPNIISIHHSTVPNREHICNALRHQFPYRLSPHSTNRQNHLLLKTFDCRRGLLSKLLESIHQTNRIVFVKIFAKVFGRSWAAHPRRRILYITHTSSFL